MTETKECTLHLHEPKAKLDVEVLGVNVPLGKGLSIDLSIQFLIWNLK